ASGTYTPTTILDRTASFMFTSGVAIYGGFAGNEALLSQRDWIANPTILSGDLLGDDGPNFANNTENSYHVVQSSEADASAILDGVTITGGNADGSECPGTGCGGGMTISFGNPTLTHVIFSGNAGSSGGGMANIFGSSPTLINVTFSGNLATGS